MPRKRKGQATPSFGFSADKQQQRRGGNGNRMETYEDTLEEGGVDGFMFKRDQIMFNARDESDDEDFANVGDEVMAIPGRSRPARQLDATDDEEEEEEEVTIPSKKTRKDKSKDEVLKGRFGKPIPDSDDENEDDSDASGSSLDEEEGWGRSYYSMPSSRREKEKEGEYDERREEDRELEEREVRRLQRKSREALSAQDFGLEDEEVVPNANAIEEEEVRIEVPVPETTDIAALLRHMEVYDPVKLALAREWPHIVRKLEKTQRGIRKMEGEKEGQLHRGLGWLHYQTLLSYASTLAFYLHLAALPVSTRPDLSTHPILTRLLDLKKALADLESLDFDAASVSDDPLLPTGWASDDESLDEDEEERELRELVKNKKELIAKLIGSGPGMGDGEEIDEDEWRKAGLEDGELDELLADAEMEMDGFDEDDNYVGLDEVPAKKGKNVKAGKKAGTEGEVKVKKVKKAKRDAEAESKAKKAKKSATTTSSFATLAEPDFFTSTSSKPASSATDMETDLGDPSALLSADAEDKDRRKRSLAFHTAKIASMANRRATARRERMSGDEDVPYRDRQVARDAVLRRQGGGAAGADVENQFGGAPAAESSSGERKRARETRDHEDDLDDDGTGEGEGVNGGDDDGYYDLVKRARQSAKSAKVAAHQSLEDQKMEALREIDKAAGEGPRSLTRAIEKNRGLTPRRTKAGRNPRVKKRQAYEKAKQKVGSQRAVFKGGQATLGGKYAGEKTGISTVVKSRRF